MVMDPSLRHLHELKRDVLNLVEYARSGCECQRPASLLLIGPEGVGKTFLMKQLSNEWELPLFGEHAHELSSPNALRSLFRRARSIKSTSFLFLDDLDYLFTDQRSPQIDPKIASIRSELYKQLGSRKLRIHDPRLKLNPVQHYLPLSGPSQTPNDDSGYEDENPPNNDNIIMVAATTSPWFLYKDHELLSRFKLIFNVGLPDREARCQLIRTMLRKIHHNLTEKELWIVADKTEGFTPKDLLEVLKVLNKESNLYSYYYAVAALDGDLTGEEDSDVSESDDLTETDSDSNEDGSQNGEIFDLKHTPRRVDRPLPEQQHRSSKGRGGRIYDTTIGVIEEDWSSSDEESSETDSHDEYNETCSTVVERSAFGGKLHALKAENKSNKSSNSENEVCDNSFISLNKDSKSRESDEKGPEKESSLSKSETTSGLPNKESKCDLNEEEPVKESLKTSVETSTDLSTVEDSPCVVKKEPEKEDNNTVLKENSMLLSAVGEKEGNFNNSLENSKDLSTVEHDRSCDETSVSPETIELNNSALLMGNTSDNIIVLEEVPKILEDNPDILDVDDGLENIDKLIEASTNTLENSPNLVEAQNTEKLDEIIDPEVPHCTADVDENSNAQSAISSKFDANNLKQDLEPLSSVGIDTVDQAEQDCKEPEAFNSVLTIHNTDTIKVENSTIDNFQIEVENTADDSANNTTKMVTDDLLLGVNDNLYMQAEDSTNNSTAAVNDDCNLETSSTDNTEKLADNEVLTADTASDAANIADNSYVGNIDLESKSAPNSSTLTTTDKVHVGKESTDHSLSTKLKNEEMENLATDNPKSHVNIPKSHLDKFKSPVDNPASSLDASGYSSGDEPREFQLLVSGPPDALKNDNDAVDSDSESEGLMKSFKRTRRVNFSPDTNTMHPLSVDVEETQGNSGYVDGANNGDIPASISELLSQDGYCGPSPDNILKQLLEPSSRPGDNNEESAKSLGRNLITDEEKLDRKYDQPDVMTVAYSHIGTKAPESPSNESPKHVGRFRRMNKASTFIEGRYTNESPIRRSSEESQSSSNRAESPISTGRPHFSGLTSSNSLSNVSTLSTIGSSSSRVSPNGEPDTESPRVGNFSRAAIASAVASLSTDRNASGRILKYNSDSESRPRVVTDSVRSRARPPPEQNESNMEEKLRLHALHLNNLTKKMRVKIFTLVDILNVVNRTPRSVSDSEMKRYKEFMDWFKIVAKRACPHGAKSLANDSASSGEDSIDNSVLDASLMKKKKKGPVKKFGRFLLKTLMFVLD